MKIAVFNNTSGSQKSGWISVFLLERLEDHVAFIKKELLPDSDLNYCGLWILSRKVEVIYVASYSNDLMNLLGKIGIEIRNFKQIQSDVGLYDLIRNLL